MEQRVVASLGLRKKKPMKRAKKHPNKFLNNVVNYLKSDSYLFSPLLDGFSSPKEVSSSISGVETDELRLEESNKKMIWKVVDYLRSDYYMYSPLIVPQPPSLCSHTDKSVPRTAATFPVGKATEHVRLATSETETGCKMREDKYLDDYPPPKTKTIRKTVAFRETVKHTVHQNCRSLSTPGTLVETETRKLVVE